MKRAAPLALLLLSAPALACPPEPVSLVFFAATTGLLSLPVVGPVSQALLHALSERSQRAGIWARRFGWINAAMGAAWLLLFAGLIGGAPLLAAPGALALAAGLYGILKRPAPAPA